MFKTMKAFGCGDVFFVLDEFTVCWGLVYGEGGLSCPIPIQRGIRQGCPISGLIYCLKLNCYIGAVTRITGCCGKGGGQKGGECNWCEMAS